MFSKNILAHMRCGVGGRNYRNGCHKAELQVSRFYFIKNGEEQTSKALSRKRERAEF